MTIIYFVISNAKNLELLKKIYGWHHFKKVRISLIRLCLSSFPKHFRLSSLPVTSLKTRLARALILAGKCFERNINFSQQENNKKAALMLRKQLIHAAYFTEKLASSPCKRVPLHLHKLYLTHVKDADREPNKFPDSATIFQDFNICYFVFFEI